MLFVLKPFQLVDLNQIEDDELKRKMWSGVMEFALKHIFERDMLPFLHDIAPTLKKLVHQGGDDFIGIVLQYIVESAEISDNQALIEFINTNISYEIGEKIMTAVEKWKQEGELEGEFKKSLQIAKAMLDAGSDPVFIVKVTELSISEVQALRDK